MNGETCLPAGAHRLKKFIDSLFPLQSADIERAEWVAL